MNMGELKVRIQKLLIFSNVGFDSINAMLWDPYFEKPLHGGFTLHKTTMTWAQIESFYNLVSPYYLTQ
jgi:hypothetical protein